MGKFRERLELKLYFRSRNQKKDQGACTVYNDLGANYFIGK